MKLRLHPEYPDHSEDHIQGKYKDICLVVLFFFQCEVLMLICINVITRPFHHQSQQNVNASIVIIIYCMRQYKHQILATWTARRITCPNWAIKACKVWLMFQFSWNPAQGSRPWWIWTPVESQNFFHIYIYMRQGISWSLIKGKSHMNIVI